MGNLPVQEKFFGIIGAKQRDSESNFLIFLWRPILVQTTILRGLRGTLIIWKYFLRMIFASPLRTDLDIITVNRLNEPKNYF